jgi:hypothetical protein
MQGRRAKVEVDKNKQRQRKNKWKSIEKTIGERKNGKERSRHKTSIFHVHLGEAEW